ncbi:hypothetical protein [Hyphomonas sp.]|uniref:hypothetical protein n=1 Tax=Hyphomonas sp. TaxID=87 RepID=UPI003242BBE2
MIEHQTDAPAGVQLAVSHQPDWHVEWLELRPDGFQVRELVHFIRNEQTNAEAFASKYVIALPMHPYLGEDDQDRIIEAIRAFNG